MYIQAIKKTSTVSNTWLERPVQLKTLSVAIKDNFFLAEGVLFQGRFHKPMSAIKQSVWCNIISCTGSILDRKMLRTTCIPSKSICWKMLTPHPDLMTYLSLFQSPLQNISILLRFSYTAFCQNLPLPTPQPTHPTFEWDSPNGNNWHHYLISKFNCNMATYLVENATNTGSHHQTNSHCCFIHALETGVKNKIWPLTALCTNTTAIPVPKPVKSNKNHSSHLHELCITVADGLVSDNFRYSQSQKNYHLSQSPTLAVLDSF